jgi:hypothetical protein
MLVGWQRQNKKAIMLAFGLLVYVLTISVPGLYWERWIIPIIPLGTLFAARLVWTLVDTLVKRRYYQTWPASLIAVLVILTLSIIPLKETIQQACLMTYPDTRALATEWIGSHVPAGSRLVRERYTAFIPDDQISVKFSYYLYELNEDDSDQTLNHYDYAVASSWAYRRFYKAPALYPEEVTFYDRLFENELVAEFQPDPWKRPGPTVRIYHLARNTSPLE